MTYIKEVPNEIRSIKVIFYYRIIYKYKAYSPVKKNTKFSQIKS